ncbi:urea transporter [Sphingopyxis lindanitolerans]|uniref:Urea transporter n=1 Tax=Sphingopyxis lindanitolerans TaxID=2054227 RepID=A0A2S8B8Y1_9SPHN|nr:urea transporter [Sphingopyxis lindanitolerans]PQM28874.1 urea transporter [Sphingopyxis lindanitolerans]
MATYFSATGLTDNDKDPLPAPLRFLDHLLRGVGQVMLQNNSYAGLLFLVGIFYHSPLFGSAVLIGTGVSTATAMLLGVDRRLVRAGMFGFNGGLVAVALLTFLQPNALTWALLVFTAACSTIVMAAMLRLLAVWKLPVLTAPFVFISWCVFLATARFGRLESTHLLPTAGLPKAVTVEGVVTASTIGEGLFNGIAQVFFQGNLVTGLIFAIGLLIASRVACAAALAGSLIGLLVAWGMGAAEPAIRSGAFGYNGVLVAVALGSSFFALDRRSLAYALLAAIATPLVFAGVSAALEPLGIPALTFPFVLVTWLFLLAAALFPSLRPATDSGV